MLGLSVNNYSKSRNLEVDPKQGRRLGYREEEPGHESREHEAAAHRSTEPRRGAAERPLCDRRTAPRSAASGCASTARCDRTHRASHGAEYAAERGVRVGGRAYQVESSA